MRLNLTLKAVGFGCLRHAASSDQPKDPRLKAVGFENERKAFGTEVISSTFLACLQALTADFFLPRPPARLALTFLHFFPCILKRLVYYDSHTH